MDEKQVKLVHKIILSMLSSPEFVEEVVKKVIAAAPPKKTKRFLRAEGNDGPDKLLNIVKRIQNYDDTPTTPSPAAPETVENTSAPSVFPETVKKPKVVRIKHKKIDSVVIKKEVIKKDPVKKPKATVVAPIEVTKPDPISSPIPETIPEPTALLEEPIMGPMEALEELVVAIKEVTPEEPPKKVEESPKEYILKKEIVEGRYFLK